LTAIFTQRNYVADFLR